MNDIGFIRNIFKPLKKTIVHPQWFSYKGEEILIEWLRKIPMNSIVVDVGCADRWAERHLTDTCRYIGLDYLETAATRYNSNVDIYATAMALPFSENSVDVVILFDVLEHFNKCETAISEVVRVLKPGGLVLVQIPFLYPLHDSPYDYQRMTSFGLIDLIERNGLSMDEFDYRGEPLETAALLLNIALAKSVITFAGKNILLKLFSYPLVGGAMILLNCFGWVCGKILPRDDFMPFSYHMILKK